MSYSIPLKSVTLLHRNADFSAAWHQTFTRLPVQTILRPTSNVSVQIFGWERLRFLCCHTFLKCVGALQASSTNRLPFLIRVVLMELTQRFRGALYSMINADLRAAHDLCSSISLTVEHLSNCRFRGESKKAKITYSTAVKSEGKMCDSSVLKLLENAQRCIISE